MTRLTLRILLVLAVVAALAGTAGTATASAATAPTIAAVPLGSAGTFDVTGFAVQNGGLVALGTVAGAPAAAPVQAAAPSSSCTLFSFSFGPFDVNVAGLVTVHVDAIAANVQVSGILGTLLCGILGGAGATPPPVPAA
jgi:hypothetical protein